jgi:multidrug efflux pump subunit AcrA (membrane-fusion protein)
LTLEAYPDTTFEGEVEMIGNLARSKYHTGGPNVFDVKVGLASVDPRFRPGMKVKVEVVVEVLEDAVFVPIESVFEREGETVVYEKGTTGFDPRAVQTGRRNDTHVAVLSGLEGGERIALVDPFVEIEG